MPSTMAPATTKTKKRQTLATTPDMVVTRAPARGEPERVAAWFGDALEEAADRPWRRSEPTMSRHDDDEEDARAAG